MNPCDIPMFAIDKRWHDIEELVTGWEFDDLSEDDKSLILIAVSYYGKEKIINEILQKGADANYSYNNYGSSECVSMGHVDIGATALGQCILGCSRGNKTFESTKILLKMKADPNLITFHQFTPLQFAIVKNCKEHAKLLLEYKADPYKKNGEMNNSDAFTFAEKKQWAHDLLEKFR